MKIEYLQNNKGIDDIIILFKTALAENQDFNELSKKNELKHFTKKMLIAKIKEDPKSIIIARDNNKILGFCFNKFEKYTLRLEWMVVKPELQRTGIGQQMMQKLTDATGRRGCQKVWCDCPVTNEVSKNFLQKNGFETICEIPNHWYKQDCVLLQKLM